ncbi:unknown [Bacteroides sp. CAG:702]|nr:unknown [Bacteroides sp. CAG:702]
MKRPSQIKFETVFFMLGYSDSNQEKQDQNLLCYHYTIAQTHNIIISSLETIIY